MTAVSVPGRAANEMLFSSVLSPSMVHVTPCTPRPPVAGRRFGLASADQRAVLEYQIDVANRHQIALV